MEALNNILNTIISKGEITYRQINYLIRESNKRGKDISTKLCDYDIKLCLEDAKKELKCLKKKHNIVQCGYREIDIISNSCEDDFLFRGLYDNGTLYPSFIPYYWLNNMSYLHMNEIRIVG